MAARAPGTFSSGIFEGAVSMFADKREGVAAALRSGVALEVVADAEGVSATTHLRLVA